MLAYLGDISAPADAVALLAGKILLIGDPKVRSSFLKKRSKRLLFFAVFYRKVPLQEAKVFWFFFQKRTRLLYFNRGK